MADTWENAGLLAAAQGRQITVWSGWQANAAKGTRLGVLNGEVTCARWSGNGRALFVGSSDGVVSFYSRGEYVGSLNQDINVHMGQITCMQNSHSASQLYVGSQDAKVMAFNLRAKTCVEVLEQGSAVTALALSDERALAVSSDDGCVLVYAVADLSNRMTLVQPDHRGNIHRCLSFSTLEPTLLASATLLDHRINLWDVGASQTQRMQLPGSVHSSTISGLSFTPSSANILYSCGYDGKVVVWDLRARNAQQQVQMSKQLTCLSVRPMGGVIAVGTAEGSVRLLDERNLQGVVVKLSGDSQLPVSDLAFQPAPSAKKSSRSSSGTVASLAASAGPAAGAQQQAPAGVAAVGPGGARRVSAQGTGGIGSGRLPASDARGTAQASLSTWLPPSGHPQSDAPPAAAASIPSHTAQAPQTAATTAQPTHTQVPTAVGIVGATPVTGGGAAAGATPASQLPMVQLAKAQALTINRTSEAGAGGGAGVGGSLAGSPTSSRAATPAGGGSVSGPLTTPRNNTHMLHENVFRDVMSQVVSELKEDIRNMHIELIRQHHMQQVDMVSLISGVVAKQTELQQDIRALKSQLDRLTKQQQITQFL